MKLFMLLLSIAINLIYPLVLAKNCKGNSEAPNLIGSYKDNYNSSHVITRHLWIMGRRANFRFCVVNNADNWLIAHNDVQNYYFPGKFSRFEWIQSDGATWFCQQVYNGDSINETIEAPMAYRKDPENVGCGVPTNNFPWSQLTPIELPIFS